MFSFKKDVIEHLPTVGAFVVVVVALVVVGASVVVASVVVASVVVASVVVGANVVVNESVVVLSAMKEFMTRFTFDAKLALLICSIQPR